MHILLWYKGIRKYFARIHPKIYGRKRLSNDSLEHFHGFLDDKWNSKDVKYSLKYEVSTVVNIIKYFYWHVNLHSTCFNLKNKL